MSPTTISATVRELNTAVNDYCDRVETAALVGQHIELDIQKEMLSMINTYADQIRDGLCTEPSDTTSQ